MRISHIVVVQVSKKINNQVSHQNGLDISSWSPNSKRSQIRHLSQIHVSLDASSRSKYIIHRVLHIIFEC